MIAFSYTPDGQKCVISENPRLGFLSFFYVKVEPVPVTLSRPAKYPLRLMTTHPDNLATRRASKLLRLMASCLLVVSCPLNTVASNPSDTGVVIGSKRFTEAYILGEIISQRLKQAGQDKVTLKSGLGNTGILVAALSSREIDLYPEYTGTITREILKTDQALSLTDINKRLLPLGLQAGVLLGFDNAYVLAMRREQAAKLKISKISDLSKHPALIPGLSHEFIGREDGWKGLVSAYQLDQLHPRGLDHGLAYEAIASGQIDIVDAYGTDSKLIRYDLTVLEDDRHFFPVYEAVLLYRADFPTRFPSSWQALLSLQNSISQQKMLELNTSVEIKGSTFEKAAAQFLSRDQQNPANKSFFKLLFGDDFWRLGLQHCLLVLISVGLATCIGLPLGILCFYQPKTGRWVLSACNIVQTIPSLAMLAFLISAFGLIGMVPAITALFLYALLPIVQNTHAGLREISPGMREAATALALKPLDRLLLIELPIAKAVILGGIQIAAVLSVGTATIAAFVGAGGFGDRIAQGLALNNNELLLAGAIPAASLALLLQFLFEKLNKKRF